MANNKNKKVNTNSEAKINSDPTKGVQVLILPHREKRPFVKKKSDCPFCKGAEDQTPPTTFALPNEKNWVVRCFENAFPIVRGRVGRHEVIVENNAHEKLFQDLNADELELVFEAYCNRFTALEKKHEFVFLFKNHGLKSGASIPHEHAQIIGLHFVPELIQRELKHYAQYRKKTGKCFYCALAKKKKVLLHNKSAVAIVPEFGRFAFETWVLPKRHVQQITDLTQEELMDFALAVQAVVEKVFAKTQDYTIAFHNQARGKDSHFHAEIYPRTSTWAGLEIGTGLIVNSKDARTALKELAAVT